MEMIKVVIGGGILWRKMRVVELVMESGKRVMVDMEMGFKRWRWRW